jgi:hypothetical protein
MEPDVDEVYIVQYDKMIPNADLMPQPSSLQL